LNEVLFNFYKKLLQMQIHCINDIHMNSGVFVLGYAIFCL